MIARAAKALDATRVGRTDRKSAGPLDLFMLRLEQPPLVPPSSALLPGKVDTIRQT